MMWDTLGYVAAALLSIGMVLGVVLTIKAMKKKQQLKAMHLAPWKVSFEFYEKEGEDDSSKSN